MGSDIKFFALLLFLFTACTSERVEPETTFIDEVIEPLERLSPEELEYMSDLLAVDSEMSTFWNGFNSFRTAPIFIQTDEDQGIFINPPSTMLDKSRPISYELDNFEQLDLYRNDEVKNYIINELNGSLYNFALEYEGIPIYAYNMSILIDFNFYHQYKNRDGYYNISVFFHELFHFYSIISNKDRFESENGVYEANDFPYNEETLPLILLLYDVTADAYNLNTVVEKVSYLKYYVSILHELDFIDPSIENLVRNNLLFREKIEGSARYIEVFSTLYTIDNNTIEDPTHGWKNYSKNITDWWGVLSTYEWRMPYHSGAGAINLLNELDCPNWEEKMLTPKNTPYDIAKEFLNLNELQLNQYLEEVKSLYDWDAMLARSEYLLSLQ